MKSHTKSSITLPPEEFAAVLRLKEQLHARSNVEVVRRALRLLTEVTDREALRESMKQASLATREALREELGELDHLAAEGLGDP